MRSRSVYLAVRRARLSPFLGVFDAPQPFTTFGRRDVTTVPAQSLALLNGPLAARCADLWETTVFRSPGVKTPEQRLEWMFWNAFARTPRPEETRVMLQALERWRAEIVKGDGKSSPSKTELRSVGPCGAYAAQPEGIYLPPLIYACLLLGFLLGPAVPQGDVRRCSVGFGSVAMAGLFGRNALAGSAAQVPHFPAKVKNVIFCFMPGGVSHVDSFDPKPELTRMAGKPMPGKVEKTQFDNIGKLLPSLWEFENRGRAVYR